VGGVGYNHEVEREMLLSRRENGKLGQKTPMRRKRGYRETAERRTGRRKETGCRQENA